MKVNSSAWVQVCLPSVTCAHPWQKREFAVPDGVIGARARIFKRVNPLAQREAELAKSHNELNQRELKVIQKEAALAQREAELEETSIELHQRALEVDHKIAAMMGGRIELDQWCEDLTERETELGELKAALDEKERVRARSWE